MSDEPNPTHTNRLVDEASPYLLQHAHNPVDWWPWCEEALELARERDAPIFLSIGYSACHWCHVMERESFEDEQVAAFLNEHFVPIKVDREERPEVDSLYMDAVQLMTGAGGWPMSVWLDEQLRPFYAGTYFPPEDRWGRPGFLTVLRELHRVWSEERERVVQTGAELHERLQAMAAPPGEAGALERAPRHELFAWLERRFDPEDGGFGQKPKFPSGANLELLLDVSADPHVPEEQRERALEMVQVTMARMASGGMYDHLGGGFHRYSVDERWLIPHFEKMLYDNAQLAQAYVAAWQRTGRQAWARKARETCDWVLEQMVEPAAPAGRPFWSTMDADSEGVEGKYFVWTPAELVEALGEEQGAAAAEFWGVSERGNFEEGASALHRLDHLDDHGHMALLDELPEPAERWRRRLLEVRAARVPPGTDTKVITAWNGLMIRALARAGAALGEPRYLEAARQAARFFVQHMITEEDDGPRLWRIYKDGQRRFPGYLEDHAFLAGGLLALFEATGEPEWLEAGEQLLELVATQFADDDGLYFTTATHHEQMIVRQKDTYDGATPSGNTTALAAMQRLAMLTASPRWRERVERGLRRLADALERNPHGLPVAARLLGAHLDGGREVLVVAPDGAEVQAAELARAARRAFLPDAVVLTLTEAQARALAPRVPWLAERGAQGGRAAAYVCRQGACQLPVTDPEALTTHLARARGVREVQDA